MFGTFWKKPEPIPEPKEPQKDLEWFCEGGTTGWIRANGGTIYYASYDTEKKVLSVAVDEDFNNCTNVITEVRAVIVRDPEHIKLKEEISE